MKFSCEALMAERASATVAVDSDSDFSAGLPRHKSDTTWFNKLIAMQILQVLERESTQSEIGN